MTEYKITSNISDVISRIFFISNRNKIAIRPMKLQKLLFFSFGWYAGKTSNRLFIEDFEAWPYGPVIPEVYRNYREWGADVIREDGRKIHLGDKEADSLVDSVVEQYGVSSDFSLSNITHEKKSPWSDVWQEDNGFDHRSTIPFEKIKEFYDKKLSDGQ